MHFYPFCHSCITRNNYSYQIMHFCPVFSVPPVFHICLFLWGWPLFSSWGPQMTVRILWMCTVNRYTPYIFPQAGHHWWLLQTHRYIILEVMAPYLWKKFRVMFMFALALSLLVLTTTYLRCDENWNDFHTKFWKLYKIISFAAGNVKKLYLFNCCKHTNRRSICVSPLVWVCGHQFWFQMSACLGHQSTRKRYESQEWIYNEI